MDGKLLVLCDEKVNLNSSNQRVDENENILKPISRGVYQNKDLNEVKIEEHKDIISAVDLSLDIETENIRNREIIYTDWETLIPSDIEYLQTLTYYSRTSEDIPSEIIFEMLKKNNSVIERVYQEVFSSIERPSIDYSPKAMDSFMREFGRILQTNRIVKVLPTYREGTSNEIRNSRQRILNSFAYRNDTFSKIKGDRKVNVLPLTLYKNFGEVFARATDEKLKILSAPDWYDKPKENKRDIEDR